MVVTVGPRESYTRKPFTLSDNIKANQPVAIVTKVCPDT